MQDVLLPLQSEEFIFKNFFHHCVERTQERLITLLSLLAEHKARSEGKPGPFASGQGFWAAVGGNCGISWVFAFVFGKLSASLLAFMLSVAT